MPRSKEKPHKQLPYLPASHIRAQFTLLKMKSENNYEYELMEAARTGDVQRLKNVLITPGVLLRDRNSLGRCPLVEAAKTGCLEAVKMLVEAGFNLNVMDCNGKTALMGAALHGYYEVVKYLLEKGADPTILNKQGHGAYTIAVYGKHMDVAQLIQSYIQKIRQK